MASKLEKSRKEFKENPGLLTEKLLQQVFDAEDEAQLKELRLRTTLLASAFSENAFKSPESSQAFYAGTLAAIADLATIKHSRKLKPASGGEGKQPRPW